MGIRPAGDAIAALWPEGEDRSLGPPLRATWNKRNNSLLDFIENELADAGVNRSDIHRVTRVFFPGAYNPSPRPWDLVVLDDDVPIAALNLITSLRGSVGKNFGNRVEAILGDTVDLSRPYEHPQLRALRPCLALFFVLEDSEEANTTLRPIRSRFADESTFSEGTSYKDRYRIFFERLIKDGRYDAICYLTTTLSSEPSIDEPSSILGLANFTRTFVERVKEIRKQREGSPFDAVELGRMLAERDSMDDTTLDTSSTEYDPLVAQTKMENEFSPSTMAEALTQSYQYDVCLSFAGEQRAYVEEVARHLTDRGIKTFYDKYEQSDLWGKDLYEHLDSIYQSKARYCILFASVDYARKVWTSHERKSAQARAFSQSEEYILPVKFDDTEIPGLRSTTGYIDARETNPMQLVSLISEKLFRAM